MSDQPSLDKRAFDCPHCRAFAHQFWFGVRVDFYDDGIVSESALDELEVGAEGEGEGYDLILSVCARCMEKSVWGAKDLLYPSNSLAPHPNEDLPDDIKRDYEEAGAIVVRSPRGAAALLRLCIQKLCGHLGESGKNLDDDIGALVRKGLGARVQQALDTVRVIGNKAVHPGVLDLKDDTETVSRLFHHTNLVVHELITLPRERKEMYSKLPKSSREAIDRRDEK